MLFRTTEPGQRFIAAQYGHVDVAKVLLQNGADVNAVDYRKNRQHFTSQLLEGYVDVVKVLLQNGADINAVEKGKSTALHVAAEKGHVDVAKVLLQNGADVNAVDKDEMTSLHYATSTSNMTFSHSILSVLELRSTWQVIAE